MQETSTPKTREIPEMRQRLLDAALELLRDDGPTALTVRNITERSGCSTTGIYTYFGGKHGLIEAIFLSGFDSFDRAVSAHYESGDLLAASKAYRTWTLAHPMHYLVMFGRAVPDYQPSEAALVRAARSFTALVDAVGRRGATNPAAAAYHVWATLHGYVMLELVGMGPIESTAPDDLYDAGLHRVLDSLA